MKACVLHAPGDLRYEEVNTPEPGPGQALVRVGGCGICGSDIPRVFTKGTYTFPTIPGHEFAGHVEKVGPEVPPEWIGRAVAVFPLIPCNDCTSCADEEYQLCQNYDYLGSRSDGAFAEYVVAPVWNLVPLPKGLSIEEATLTEPAAVALHAVLQGKVEFEDTVAIFGAGPIGLLVGMWAMAHEAHDVVLFDVDDERLDFAASLGFRHCSNPTHQDPDTFIRELWPDGATVVVEASGNATAYANCLAVARHTARVVLLGNPAAAMPLTQDQYWLILRKQLLLVGSWNSSYRNQPDDDWHQTLEAMASKTLDVSPLITHRVGLDEVQKALTMMRDRTKFSNKILFLSSEQA